MTIMDDERYLRCAIEIANEAAATGKRPFGALIVSAAGEIVAEGSSTQQDDRDWTAHAEMNVLRVAGKTMSWPALSQATLYASGDPCPMCAGAVYWSNVRRLVYGADEISVRHLRANHPQGAGLTMSCRDVLAHSPRPIYIVEPMLVEGAIKAHEMFWQTTGHPEGWV